MSIIETNSFEFKLKNKIEYSLNGTQAFADTLYLHEPKTINYTNMMKLRSHLTKAFYSEVMPMINKLSDKKTSEVILDDDSKYEQEKNIVSMIIDNLGDDYEKYINEFKSLMCKSGICYLNKEHNINIKDGWVKSILFDDLENMAIEYSAKYIFPKRLLG
ncbi:hypothetical protein [Fangia hongkongensis]|uniref:hypothetical protein n=1 Tax=Fangia hongkongensis TaxID=270495 RepID=UPI000382423F|nr:hypothetical protein [Fangia hongkongensis]MBK2125550.1 hypothetical protein [Fangia hongkongensis]